MYVYRWDCSSLPRHRSTGKGTGDHSTGLWEIVWQARTVEQKEGGGGKAWQRHIRTERSRTGRHTVNTYQVYHAGYKEQGINSIENSPPTCSTEGRKKKTYRMWQAVAGRHGGMCRHLAWLYHHSKVELPRQSKNKIKMNNQIGIEKRRA